MSELFRNKYRIKSVRLSNWDYGCNGAYFITICTKNRKFYFGNVVDGKMDLTEIGQIAKKFWMDIPGHFPYVELDAFVVMPNHVHGILVINKKTIDGFHLDDSMYGRRDVALQRLYNGNQQPKTMSNISPKQGTISTIIRSYKSVVTKHARKIDIGFGWQERFYDHIIRNNASHKRIRNYIIENPKKWQDDRFYG